MNCRTADVFYTLAWRSVLGVGKTSSSAVRDASQI